MIIYIKYRGFGILDLKVQPNLIVYNLVNFLSQYFEVDEAEINLVYSFKDQEITLENQYNLEYYGVYDRSCILLKKENEAKHNVISLETFASIYNSIQNLHRTSRIFFANEPVEQFFQDCMIGNYEEVQQAIIKRPELSYVYNDDGFSAIHVASQTGDSQLMQILIENKVDTNHLTRDSQFSALHIACLYENINIVNQLLSVSYTEIDIDTEQNGTPLHCACIKNNLEIVEILLLSKANYSIENQVGLLPVEIASKQEIKDLLYQYMGENQFIQRDFQGELVIVTTFKDTKCWAVLKILDGTLNLYNSFQDYDRGQIRFKQIRFQKVKEVRRCKDPNIFSQKGFYFHIIYKHKKIIFKHKNEEFANLWVKNLFTTLLYKHSNTATLAPRAQAALSQLPISVNVSYKDFIIQHPIGKGSYGRVFLACKKDTRQIYAIKMFNKTQLLRTGSLQAAINEATVLRKLDNFFINKLHYVFQTSRAIYLVVDYCPNSSLKTLLFKTNFLPLRYAQIYTAEILIAITYLHNLGIFYRDLKCENVMLDQQWHVKLVDFGLSLENFKPHTTTNSSCGSPAYFSPEQVAKQPVGLKSDIYALGCILFEMLAGYPPFYSSKISKLLSNIKEGDLVFPKYMPQKAQDLISQLLQYSPDKRPNYDQIKAHEFFEGINFEDLEEGILPDLEIAQATRSSFCSTSLD